jgi:hypothetical protein
MLKLKLTPCIGKLGESVRLRYNRMHAITVKKTLHEMSGIFNPFFLFEPEGLLEPGVTWSGFAEAK